MPKGKKKIGRRRKKKAKMTVRNIFSSAITAVTKAAENLELWKAIFPVYPFFPGTRWCSSKVCNTHYTKGRVTEEVGNMKYIHLLGSPGIQTFLPFFISFLQG